MEILSKLVCTHKCENDEGGETMKLQDGYSRKYTFKSIKN